MNKSTLIFTDPFVNDSKIKPIQPTHILMPDLQIRYIGCYSLDNGLRQVRLLDYFNKWSVM